MIESNSTSKFSSFFRRKPKDVKLDMNGNGLVSPHDEHQDELEDPMASVSIRVRNEEGDDFVVSPSDVVDNINEINSRRSSRRDSTPASSIRRSRPSSSAYFNENGEPIEGINRPPRKFKSMDHIMMRLFKPSKARKSKSVRDAEPGLRSMLYGLSQKQEKEEAIAKKLAKKMIIQEEKAMQAVPTSPVDASKFVAYVQERRKKRILFKGEYLMVNRSIDNNKCRCDVGSTMMDRNPYPDTLPYDYNRVILPRIDGDENSHYINASYVNSWLRDKAYVVTQAVRTKPMNAEFWRMVWELGSNCIVMLTKVFDFMRVMCLQYWPLTKFQFREIEVETTEVKTYSHFVIRTFKLTRTTPESIETRIVKHFHFTEWELDSFPYISAFIELRRRVRQFMEKNPVEAPMVVHCSNGAGRSGAFLALDANLELMKKTGQLDFFEYAKTLVNSRPHLIDSVEQYMFIYEVLSEAVMCNVQPIEMHLLKERSSMYKAKKNRELLETQETHENKLLMHLTPTLRIGDCAGGHRLENRGKNRDVMVVPPDHARPYLQTLHGESKDYTYINAVEVDGFTRKAEFIVTEWPKQSTVDSFWTLIYDHACHTVVNLSNQGSQRHYPSFIHNKGKANYGPFIVEIMNYHQYPAMTSHMVKVMKRTFMISDIMATGAQNQQIDAEVRICCVIQVRMWPIENKVPLSTTGLIDVIKMARSWRKRAPDRPETKPTIVMSHNGVSRVGVYIGANICIDQMDIDHEVDVFHAVKMMRINRPQLIDMKDEYKYLYDVMLHWYMTNPDYRIYDKEDSEDTDSQKTSRPPSNRHSIKEKSSFRSKFSFRRRNTTRQNENNAVDQRVNSN
ncbi:Receptor-type tyrosine-protein phosphatase kappa [Caenorhabditis elegans]|uniref:Receptor-type tyrosine-protein phosphatase kappa n=3 Tax=Caenorhabditis elegans TaxID=6239 RepID=G5EGI0_CAEEL|nr:Receptor-type tyrosine-protein phosphatase kappa [Caenorhabditis elegans]CAA91422.4 Receptor-type tyrosine-protein phosphatase kappa [Caenorhabditis elegans]|eukprot:NP_001022346.2 Tyrosine-protein phosphatase [Caenorhabditis elegans]